MIEAGAIVLLLFAFMGRRASAQDEQQQPPPPGGDGGKGLADGLKAAAAIVPTAVSIAGSIAGLGGGGAAVAGGGSATTVAATTGTTAGAKGAAIGGGVSAGSISGLVVEAVGGSLIIIGIIAAIATVMIADAVAAYRAAQEDFIRKASGPRAQQFFDLFVAKYAEAKSGSSVRVILPTGTLRQVVLTALFLGYRQSAARNDALVKFYAWAGYGATQMAQLGVWADYWAHVSPRFTAPANDGYGNFNEAYRVSAALWTNALDHSTGVLEAPQQGYAEVTAPVTSVAEMETAARALLGAQYDRIVYEVEFFGSVGALTAAAVQGYGDVYPGDQQFATTLARVMVGWSVAAGTYRAANGNAPYAWWATDPHSGNRFDIAGVRAWQLNIAVAGS